MADPRVVLAADDPALLQQVQSLLRESAGSSAYTGPYAAVADRLTCDSDGLLLLGVSNLAEQSQAKQLIQQLSMQKWPAVVVVLNALGSPSFLESIDRHISRSLRWPEEAGRLATLVKELERGRQFRFSNDSTLEDTLCRRLLALTPSLLPLADRIALGASHDVTVLSMGRQARARLI